MGKVREIVFVEDVGRPLMLDMRSSKVFRVLPDKIDDKPLDVSFSDMLFNAPALSEEEAFQLAREVSAANAPSP